MPENRFKVRVRHRLQKEDSSFEVRAHTVALTPQGQLEIHGDGPCRRVMPPSGWLSITVDNVSAEDAAAQEMATAATAAKAAAWPGLRLAFKSSLVAIATLSADTMALAPLH